MANSSSSKPFLNPYLQAKLLRLRVALIGLGRDYWKDTPFSWPTWFKLKPKMRPAGSANQANVSIAESWAQGQSGADKATVVKPVREPQKWAADRVGVVEQMWGSGHAFPGGEEYLEKLSSPLGINSDMSILDLSAGLGDMARHLAELHKAYVTGMETDSALAARGMVMSIAAGKSKMASVVAYDPVNFTASRKYDCVFVRELFYLIIGKDKFFKAIDSSIKSGGGQIVFTDYILDPAARDKPAVIQWLKRERGAAPLSSIEMIKMWKGMGYDLRIAEDQTAEYKVMILTGLKNFVDFMVMNRPDAATKLLVVREVDLWVRRMEAFGAGLKYYRFFGIKH